MKKGEFILIEFIGRLSGTNEIFDLTSEDEAKRQGIHNPKHKYGPALVIIGAKMVIPGVEKQLEGMRLGEERGFSVKPEEGFGKRDVRMIKIISLASFRREKINPVPGIFVTINGRQAKVQSVSGGRVRIDFNHPLAGKELNYYMKIVKVIKDTKEKTIALLKYYNLEFKITLNEGNLSIESEKGIPELIQDVLRKNIPKWIPEVKKIDFVSKEKPGKKKQAEKKEKPAGNPGKPNV